MARSPIRIKKSTQGSYRARAKKNRRTVLQQAAVDLSSDSQASPAIKKKANFARNFSGKGKGR